MIIIGTVIYHNLVNSPGKLFVTVHTPWNAERQEAKGQIPPCLVPRVSILK